MGWENMLMSRRTIDTISLELLKLVMMINTNPANDKKY